MGNSLNNEAADWNEETIKEITTELKKQIGVVDRSMTGLAKSIDSMQVACKMLLLQQDKKEDSQETRQEDETDEETQSGSSLSHELLRSINESVTDHKFIAMEVLCKLIHFIENTIQTTGVLQNEGGLELALDAYLNTKIPNEREEAVSYYDKKIESLSTQVRKLMEIKRRLHNRIDLMHSTEDTLIKEKNILKKQVNRLETELKMKTEEARTLPLEADVNKDSSKKKHTETKHDDDNDQVKNKQLIKQTKELADMATKLHVKERELADVPTERNKLKDEKCNVDRENEKLKEELESLKCRTVDQEFVKLKDEKVNVELENGTSSGEKKTYKYASAKHVQVQIYRQYARSSVDSSFEELLESKAKTKFLQIESLKCNSRDSVQRNIPVLILCDERYISSYARPEGTTVEGIEATKEAALVIFHMSTNKTLSFKKGQSLKGYHPYCSLGVIVDAVFDYSVGMHNCDDNDAAIDEILNFISKNLGNETTHNQQRNSFLQR